MNALLLVGLLLQASPSAAPQRPPPSTADLPAWSRTPSAEDMARAYPPEAARVSYAGSASLECTVDATGGLTDCVVAEQTQPEFGQAALAVAPKFQLPTRSPSGAATAGRTIRFPVRWLSPAKATAPPIVIYDDSGRSGSVGFNCRVAQGRALDNCVVVDAKPRGANLFATAGEAVLRAKAPAKVKPWTRLMVVVEVKPR